MEEGGGGEAEGFEEAEAELIERAENAHGPSPIADAGDYDEEAGALDAEYGEADEEHTSEDGPGARATAERVGTLRLRWGVVQRQDSGLWLPLSRFESGLPSSGCYQPP